MVQIKLKEISKSFQDFKALDNISLEIKDKEYFIILGPTGGGKTTLLKIIAGLIKPESGSVYFDNEDVTQLSPGERNLGFMFENYALFPHMNIYDNIAYSSRVHARDPKQTETIVEQVLMMTLLTGRNEALPKEMSGGMRQRVALCRALMNLEQTRLLILDEPLKALDAGLRMSLRRELLLMAKSKLLELTVIHVTNEEEEAMMLADRIAVINEGKLVQVGTPYEIFYQPSNLFVANFMSEINYFTGTCVKNGPILKNNINKSNQIDKFFAEIKRNSVPMKINLGLEKCFTAYTQNQLYNKIEDGEEVLLVVRANHMKLRIGNRIEDKHNSLLGTIYRRKFMGLFYRFEVKVLINELEKILIITIPATSVIHDQFLENSEVTVYFPEELGIVFKNPGNDVIKELLKLE
ncbi:MAG: ATP-binding cassette domain-containing protein [Candidatus Lokiarchaeota archaeon]|nr:ATP-binding cassette domain-containing protein [Candidatus Lokiarchaeota archaeon]MBD3341499.1 ATP-binding cassette domain-containing protein [Candidatus Lokiarchaeota archaeon]